MRWLALLLIGQVALASDIPLFRAYPSLKKALSWTPILEGPSPIQPLAGLQQHLFPGMPGEQRLWVKRDDRSWDALGGNKARKLEFLIAYAQATGRHQLVTSGMIGSNHCLSTALAAKRFALHATLVLGPQPITEDVKHKLLAMHALGAELHYHDSETGMGAELAEQYLKSQVDNSMMYIPPGGSSKLGSVGYVNAFLELMDQVGMVGLPDRMIVPVGTAGTATGLLVGSCLAGAWERTQLIGVGVQIPKMTNERVVRRDAQRLYNFLAAQMSAEDRVRMPKCNFLASRRALVFSEDYYLPSYGAAIPSVYTGIQLLRETDGIKLDITYSGKAMRYLLDDLIRTPISSAQVPKTLFWLTYDSYDLNQIIDAYPWKNPREKWRELPSELWRVFQ